MHFATSLAATLFLVGSSPGAWSQTAILEAHGDAVGDGFGASVRGAGDVDGDGHDDWIVGAPASDAAAYDAGLVRVLSGATGAVLHTFQGSVDFERFGMSVDGAGDVDADGHADLVVGAPGDFLVGGVPGSVHVFSGRDGSLLHLFVGDTDGDRFGAAVRAAGDVDDDGHADLIVGAPQAAAGGVRPGMARVFSGIDGNVLYTVTGKGDEDQLGHAVGAAGDVDGDGVQDFAVGAPEESRAGARVGCVRVYSGASGKELWARPGLDVDGGFGRSLDALRDVTGDGHPDLVVGAPTEFYEHGVVRVLSGAGGDEVFSIRGASRGGLLGANVGAVDDWDGDGNGDFVAGAGRNYTHGIVSGFVGVYSGLDGAPLFERHGVVGSYFGWDAAGAGDTNGDGLSEIVVGAYRATGDRGSAFVFTPLDCPSPTAICAGRPNSAGAGATLAAEGSTSLVANALTLLVEGGPPNQFGLLFAGTASARLRAGDGLVCVGGALSRFPSIEPLDASGAASITLDLHALPEPLEAGETRYFQLWYRDPSGGPAGYNFSDALAVRFCP